MLGLSRLLPLAAVALLATGPAQAAVFTVDLFGTGVPTPGSPITTLAAAKTLIAAGSPATATAPLIDLDDLGDPTTGASPGGTPYPIAGDLSDVAAKVSGFFVVPLAGTYTFAVNHDDGFELSIDGGVVSSFAGLTDNATTLSSIALSAGLHSVDLIGYEHLGGFSMELWWAPGALTAFSIPPFALLPPSDAPVPAPGVLWLLAGGLSIALARRQRVGC